MRPALKVIEPGLFTVVQDLGRIGYQRFGIPVSGALDPVALRAANIVVGNPQDAAGLEIALTGPTLDVEADSVRIAVAGGRTGMTVERRGGEPHRVGTLTSITLERGDRFRISTVEGSSVAYLTVAGSFDLPPFLGSLSTYARGGFGGFEGRALQRGDRVPLLRQAAPERADMALERFELALPPVVRIVPGPQDDWFTSEAMAMLLGSEYTVSREADRMGLRLEGPRLAHAKGANIVSDGIAPGAIQVPGNGLPIVLLADRQTTGGYPKIATVISVDLPALGRVSPGAKLHFVSVSVDAAEAERIALETRLRALSGQLVPVGAMGLDLARLLEVNLISGVADANAIAVGT